MLPRQWPRCRPRSAAAPTPARPGGTGHDGGGIFSFIHIGAAAAAAAAIVLALEHQVDLSDIEPAGDVAEEVAGRLGGVAELAQASGGVVEDPLALADQQDASLRVPACHVSSPGGSESGGLTEQQDGAAAGAGLGG
jgi:hypothetical protein